MDIARVIVRRGRAAGPISSTKLCARRGLCVAGLLAALTVPATAQLRVTVGRMPTTTFPAGDPFAAVIQPSEEATTLLRRTGEAIDRKDWKLAIDSLQRIIELPGEHVLSEDGKLYESARRYAHRRIASLPPEGLSAYRLVHDGEASSLLSRGVEAHDPQALRTVIDRFLCTRSGDEATITLADWLIDEGQFAEASALLESVFGAGGSGGIYPDADVPRWVVTARLAVCAAGLGQRQRAESLLETLATQPAAETRPADAAVATAGAADRTADIRAYIRSATHQPGVQTAASWPMAMGSPARDGKQPLVEPAIQEQSPPWEESLTTREPKAGVGAVQAYAQRERLLPVRQAVTDGRLLLVKRDTEILALDADSFMPVWSTKPRKDEGQVTVDATIMQQQQLFLAAGRHPNDTRASVDAQMRTDPVVVRTLYDSVSAGITIHDGMAVTVEWLGDPPPVMDPNMMRRIAVGMGGRDPSADTYPNQIVAYSLETGEFLWRSQIAAAQRAQMVPARPGLPQPLTPPPATVEFLSAPVPVRDVLVAPYRLNTDLYAAVLNPKDGTVLRQIYLCGTGGGVFDSLQSLGPCVADSLLVIPTGRGLLVALEVSDWSIRWAVRYETMSTEDAGGWLPTPVIAVSDVVILAPTDSNYLFCFDRGSGQLRWKAPRGKHTYVVAANDRHIWVAGDGAAMLETETGHTVWRHATGAPAGRGVLSGDRLYLPTVDKVVALKADTGEELAVDQGMEMPPLGNLLAWEGSVYSVTPFRINKYPDLGRGYEQALARHRENPADASRSVRLAALELLLHRPQKALDALARVDDGLRERDRRQFENVIQLRVRAMLDLVREGKLEASAAEKLLQEARTIAIRPQDAIESSLALGEHYRRQGKPIEAALQYLTLVLSEEGDAMMEPEGGTERRARGVAVSRFAEVVRDQAEAALAPVHERINAWLAEVEQAQDQTRALYLAENPALGDASYRAALLLGKWAARDLRFEPAESYFQRVLSGAASPDLRAEASARLAALCLQPEELHQPMRATELIDRLRHEFAAITIPADVLDPTGEATTQPAGGAKLTGAQVAQALQVDAKVLLQHRDALTPPHITRFLPAPPGIRLHPGARPLVIRGERIEPLADTMLLMVGGNKVEAHNPADNRLLWPAELRLLGDLAVEPRAPENWQNQPHTPRSDHLGRARGVTAGQTLVVNTSYGLHALGLLTGRRLWSRRFDPPETSGEPSGSDAWIWTHNGYMVSVDARRRLEVAFVSQGDRVLWRSTREDRKWTAVRARGEYVVAVDAPLEQVDVYRLEDGRYLGQCKFEQDNSPNRQVNITLYDDVICGPASGREVVALELSTPGVERWRLSPGDELSQIFKPSPTTLAIADRTGGIIVIDPATGKQLMEARVESCGNGIVDGALIDGTLYVYGYQTRVTDPNDADKQQWALAAIRMDSGAVLWQRGGFEARTHLSEEVLRASANVIPVATFIPAGSRQVPQQLRADGAATTVGTVELTLIDKSTGKPVAERQTAPLTMDTGASRIVDVQVWPRHILVVSGSSWVRFGTDTERNLHPQSRRDAEGSFLASRPAGGLR